MIHLKSHSEENPNPEDKTDPYLYQKGIVSDIQKKHAEVTLPSQRIVNIKFESEKDSIKWRVGEIVPAILRKNHIDRGGRGVHEHGLKEIIPSSDERYSNAMDNAEKTFREIELTVDDLESLPELLQEGVDQELSQSFFTITPGKYTKTLPSHNDYVLNHIIHNHSAGENRLDFLFEKQQKSNKIKRFELDELKTAMESSPEDFHNAKTLAITLGDLSGFQK